MSVQVEERNCTICQEEIFGMQRAGLTMSFYTYERKGIVSRCVLSVRMALACNYGPHLLAWSDERLRDAYKAY